MGREIYTWIKKGDETVWVSYESMDGGYICGRDDATNSIAMRVDDWENPVVDFSTFDSYSGIARRLVELSAKNDALLNRLKEEREDLRECRRKAQTLDAFDDFTGAMRETDDEIDEASYDKARDMLDIMRRTLSEARKLYGCQALTPDPTENMGIGEYRMFWVVSE